LVEKTAYYLWNVQDDRKMQFFMKQLTIRGTSL